MSEAVMLIGGRDEFERWRYCGYCGRRLLYSEWKDGPDQVFSKRCPKHVPGDLHDAWGHRHTFPYRNRHGRLSDGTRNFIHTVIADGTKGMRRGE